MKLFPFKSLKGKGGGAGDAAEPILLTLKSDVPTPRRRFAWITKSTSKLSNFWENMKVKRRTRPSALRDHFNLKKRRRKNLDQPAKVNAKNDHYDESSKEDDGIPGAGSVSNSPLDRQVEECYDKVFRRPWIFPNLEDLDLQQRYEGDARAFRGSYRFLRMLQAGAFSKVYLGIHLHAREFVGIKVVDKWKIQTELELAYKEVAAYEELEHPNICKMLQWFDTPNFLFLVLENCDGDLFEMVEEKGRLGEPSAKRIFLQLVDAVQYMHGRGFAHRDLKPENVLFNGKGCVKLCDFNLVGRIFKEGEEGTWRKLRSKCGSLEYAAPELLDFEEEDEGTSEGYEGPPVDCWALGVILYFMLSRSVPFSEPEQYYKITYGRFSCPSYMSRRSVDLIQRLLVPDPTKRLNTAQILGHAWITGGKGLKDGTLPGNDWEYGNFVRQKYQTEHFLASPLDQDIIQEMAGILARSAESLEAVLSKRKYNCYEFGLYNILVKRKAEKVGASRLSEMRTRITKRYKRE